MILLAPIFLDKEPVDWETPDWSKKLTTFFSELAKVQGVTLRLIATNSQAIAYMSHAYSGLETVIRDSPREKNFYSLIANSLDSRITDDSLIIGVHFRNPALTADIITRAMERFYLFPETPLVSVRESEHNPSQLREHYSVAEAGLIHLFADEKELSSFRRRIGRTACSVSKPFPFQWKTSTKFWNYRSILDKTTVGVQLRSESNSISKPRIVWFRENDRTARILWFEEEPPKEMAGMASGEFIPGITTAIMTNGRAGMVLVTSHTSVTFAQLIPFNTSGILPHKVMSIPIKNGIGALGGVADDVSGFIYALERPCIKGDYTSERWFDPDGKLWNGHDRTLQSGERITGRQNAPKVFEADQSLFIGTLSQADSISGGNLGSRVRGFVLAPNKSGLILTSLDVMRYEARERVKKDQKAI